MRDARTGGNTKPQLISEHGAGQKPNKKPRPFHAAALKQADAHERKQRQVQQVVDNYAANPRESARKLHQLGMTAEFIRTIHKSAVPNKRTEPAPGAPGFRGLAGGLDTAAEFATGGLVKPSHAPGNVLQHLGIGTHGLPHDQAPHTVDAATARRALTGDPQAKHALAESADTNRNIGMVPFGGFRLGGLSRKAKGAAKEAPKATPKPKPHVPPYVGRGFEGVESIPGKAHEKGFLYHRTTPEALRTLRKKGLVPTKPEGNPAGVYFGNEPLQAKGLSQKGGAHAYVRVPKHLARDVEERAFGESRTPHAVPPKHLDYLGADGKWHPFSGETPQHKAVVEMKFPGEMPGHVQSAAGRLASQLDKDSVKALRKEQERLHHEERGKRAQVAHAMLLKHAGTEKASRIAKSKLAGEMPKVPLSKVLGEMSADDLNVLRKYIHTNPRMQFFEKLDVENALEKGLSGHPPTDRERELLHKAFGKEFATRLEMPSFATRAKRVAGDIANLPRSIESAYDVSAPMRQGLVAGARHPVISAKNFGPMLKSVVSEGAHTKRIAEIEHRPNYELYRRAKLALTDVGHDVGPREEFFPSHLGDKVPGVKQSGRAYTDYLVNTRADMFDRQVELAKKAGVDVKDQHFLDSLGRMVNSATGRGDLGSLEGVGKVLNATLFSPRLLKSRLDFLSLNPTFYAKLHPQVRKEAFRAAIHTIAFGVATLELAAKAGAGVELDPRSSDFGKMRFGDTRIDIWGGFQPVVRTVAQIATGKRKTTTTGDIVALDGKFGHSSRLEVFQNFIRGKLAPVPSVGADILKGSTFVGQPVTLKTEATQRLIPFGIQDAYDVHHGGHSALETAGAYGLSAVGVGVQNYANDPAKRAKQAHDDLSKAFEANLRHYYKIGLTPQIKKALKLREARAVYLAKNLGGNASPLDRYNAQIDLAVKLKLITPKQGHGAKSWATKQDEHKLKTASTALGREYFGGDVLSAASKQIRDKGGKFYLSDKGTWKP